ncbi:hypothetical protein BDV26DRAFT_278849 [Aspergillus bertholletiae]|uniref:LysM domain-containing protein n=1 Tax=Aspergillus bertholletiae TaxID=1226010 RepID=A0A5N7BHJ5_9EURO|nr:hypothetical protein BDV26DRAFT_278849 [Aspergillus bertholletiae]
MHLPLVCSALFVTTALGYRIFEYTDERCTGAQARLHHLAGPSSCERLNDGVTSSVLVKIDNIHDDQYAVNVYDDDDCTDSVVGYIRNMNGCLTRSPFSTVGRSIKVVPIQKSAKMRDILVPIAHGLFRTVNEANHTEDGVYADEAFDLFLPTNLEHVSSIQRQ